MNKRSVTIDVAFATERDCKAGLPLVEVGNHRFLELACDVLWGECQRTQLRRTRRREMYGTRSSICSSRSNFGPRATGREKQRVFT